MKVRGVAARRGDTPEYVRRMQQELFDVLAEAKNLEELCWLKPKALGIRKRYIDGLESVDVGELAIRRRVGRLSYSRRCAEASAVRAYSSMGVSLAPGMEIGYVVKDVDEWEVEPEGNVSGFNAEYYRKLMEMAWGEVAFVFRICN